MLSGFVVTYCRAFPRILLFCNQVLCWFCSVSHCDCLTRGTGCWSLCWLSTCVSLICGFMFYYSWFSAILDCGIPADFFIVFFDTRFMYIYILHNRQGFAAIFTPSWYFRLILGEVKRPHAWRQDVDFDSLSSLFTSLSAKHCDVNFLDRSWTEHFLLENVVIRAWNWYNNTNTCVSLNAVVEGRVCKKKNP